MLKEAASSNQGVTLFSSEKVVLFLTQFRELTGLRFLQGGFVVFFFFFLYLEK